MQNQNYADHAWRNCSNLLYQFEYQPFKSTDWISIISQSISGFDLISISMVFILMFLLNSELFTGWIFGLTTDLSVKQKTVDENAQTTLEDVGSGQQSQLQTLKLFLLPSNIKINLKNSQLKMNFQSNFSKKKIKLISWLNLNFPIWN